MTERSWDEQDWKLAERLAGLDLGMESRSREKLRTRLAWMRIANVPARERHAPTVQKTLPDRSWTQPSFQRRWTAVAVVGLLMVFLAVFNQPVLAAVQRMLGYGYLPEVGFFRVQGTRLLAGPTALRQGDHEFQVQQGIVLAGKTGGTGVTWIWVDGISENLNPAETYLELADGARLPIQAIERTGAERIRLEFSALPPGSQQVHLVLSSHATIPLDFIPAENAGLAPTDVYTPTVRNTPPGEPCLTGPGGWRACVSAASVDETGTRLLLEIQPRAGGEPVAWAAGLQAELRSGEQSFALAAPVEVDGMNPAALVLRFGPLPGGIDTVTLHVAALPVAMRGNLLDTSGPYDLVLRLPVRSARLQPTPVVLLPDHQNPAPAPTPVGTRRP